MELFLSIFSHITQTSACFLGGFFLVTFLNVGKIDFHAVSFHTLTIKCVSL